VQHQGEPADEHVAYPRSGEFGRQPLGGRAGRGLVGWSARRGGRGGRGSRRTR
jgi:hypothetical protein